MDAGSVEADFVDEVVGSRGAGAREGRRSQLRKSQIRSFHC